MAVAKALSLAYLFTFHYLVAANDTTLASSISSECISFISKYPPTISLYASEICHVCQGFGISPSVEPCCSNSNPTACFASSFYGISLSDATRSAPITVAPASLTGAANCETVISIIESCQNASPGFANLCFQDQQSCYCSTAGTWAPDFFDNYWSSCLAWASTASPAEYSLFGPHTNGVVQSRPCHTWEQFTATGGTPSDCNTSPADTLSSTSVLTAIQSTLVPATSSGVAAGFGDMQAGACVVVIIHVVNMYLAV